MDSTRRKLLSAIATTTSFAGCLGGDDGAGSRSTDATTDSSMTETETSMTETTTSMPDDATVRVSSHPDFGEVLVGPEGRTLYLFENDTNGTKESVCYDSCAGTWPPLTVGESPTKSKAVSASVTTLERETGETQVMAGGWPLYYFASDTEPGDANGQGLNDVWWVVAPDGTAIKPASSATKTKY
jgi:predicted lipoprotein with Yx(FWY)xxD motif